MTVTADERVTTGLSFALTDEQRELRSLARRVRGEGDPSEGRGIRRAPDPIRSTSVAKAHELGLMNPPSPRSTAGLGLPSSRACSREELAWGCAGVATSMVANSLGTCR